MLYVGGQEGGRRAEGGGGGEEATARGLRQNMRICTCSSNRGADGGCSSVRRGGGRRSDCGGCHRGSWTESYAARLARAKGTWRCLQTVGIAAQVTNMSWPLIVHLSLPSLIPLPLACRLNQTAAGATSEALRTMHHVLEKQASRSVPLPDTSEGSAESVLSRTESGRVIELLERTESGRLIEKAHRLVAESQAGIAVAQDHHVEGELAAVERELAALQGR
eukprot:SAG31_NODE_2950_length_4870_cov_3.507860_4_plen_221_part_00